MIDTLYYIALILVFIRITSFLITSQIFFPPGVPNAVKIFLPGVLSYLIMPGIDYKAVSAVTSNYILASYIINEALTGVVLGFITNLCFMACRMVGQLVDIQIGFGMLTQFDPTTQANETAFERMMYWLGVVVFFAIDGQQLLIKSVIDSFNVIGIGKFIINQKSVYSILDVFIKFFSMGLRIAIPIVLVLLLTDIVMSLVSRSVPQINVMILGLPVKLLLGFSCIMILLPTFIKYFAYLFNMIPDTLKTFYKTVPLMIVFAADDKTEEATPKKKSEARKKGQIARSKEVNLTFTLVASTLVIELLSGYVITSLSNLFAIFLGNYLKTQLTVKSVAFLLVNAALKAALILLPIVIPIMVFGVLGNFIQGGILLTGEPLKPKLSKINPIEGFKRMFSSRSLGELVKDSAIVIILGYVGYNFIMSNMTSILNMTSLKINQIPISFSKLIGSIFFKVSLIMVIIAAIDYFFQRYRFNKDLKMTKQEVKEEFKQEEGDPLIKGKIRQKQREMSTKRMMQSVPNATVVVTNPTHLAVALRYEEGENGAPVVVAKGADRVAIRIKEIAKENDVPIIENKPLARLIYKEVEVDSEIPADMYQVVAEVLAVVLRMKKKK